MLDILMVSCKESQPAQLWVTFLTSCFQQICKEEKRPPFKLSCVGVEEVLEENPGVGWNGSRLQIVIACPSFMEKLGCHPVPSLLASLIQPATVVAMMLGVQPSSLDSHHLSNMFKFEQWRKLVVKNQDVAFVGDFLGVSMDILSRSWQLQQAINQIKTDNNNYAHFSLLPKKLKVGQNKLIVLLSDPVGTSDRIKISVDRNGQKFEIASFKRRNPYTLQFSMPGVCLQTSALVSVNVERNGKSLGQRLVKCESRLRELEQIIKTSSNPINFMCQALGINPGSREQLDNVMVASLQKNLPPHFNLLTSATLPIHANSNEELPTLLHFGARFGLEKLCWELLECPGGWQACSIRNSSNMTPAEIAQHFGHTKLCHAIKGYSQMTELSSMYSYLKGMSERDQVLDETNYLLPRPLSDTYAVPPAARPLTCPPAPPPPQSLPTLLLSSQSPPTCPVLTPTSPDSCSDYQNALATMSQQSADPCQHPDTSTVVENKDYITENDINALRNKQTGIGPSMNVDKNQAVSSIKSATTREEEMLNNGVTLKQDSYNTTTAESDNYQVPTTLAACSSFPLPSSEDYQVPLCQPTPLPTLPVFLPPLEIDNYQVPPAARPLTPSCSSEPASPLHSHHYSPYLHMHSPAIEMHGNQFDLELARRRRKLSDTVSFSSDQLSVKSIHERCSSSQSCSTTGKSSPQEELIEIINDFKNNVFTIAEVEKLVDSWRNRNDVQQSFRERQDQLEQMRQEYERIQSKMKDHMKRATPFERIKKFFTRKSKSGLDVSRVGRNSLDSVCHRPLSSLSLHSSSSSSSTGRMSTGSGTSLGDSGTHSDQDSEKPVTEEFVFHERLQSVRERSETSGGSLGGEEYVATCSPCASDITKVVASTATSVVSHPDQPPLPLPPRDRDLSHVHAACDPYRLYVNQSDISCVPSLVSPANGAGNKSMPAAEPDKVTFSRQETVVVQVHRVSNESTNEDLDTAEIQTEDEEEDPLQTLEDLALSPCSAETSRSSDRPNDDLSSSCLSHLSSSDLELLEQSQKLLKSVADSLQESEPLLNTCTDYSSVHYMNVSPFPSMQQTRVKYKSVIL